MHFRVTEETIVYLEVYDALRLVVELEIRGRPRLWTKAGQGTIQIVENVSLGPLIEDLSCNCRVEVETRECGGPSS